MREHLEIPGLNVGQNCRFPRHRRGNASQRLTPIDWTKLTDETVKVLSDYITRGEHRIWREVHVRRAAVVQ